LRTNDGDRVEEVIGTHTFGQRKERLLGRAKAAEDKGLAAARVERLEHCHGVLHRGHMDNCKEGTESV